MRAYNQLLRQDTWQVDQNAASFRMLPIAPGVRSPGMCRRLPRPQRDCVPPPGKSGQSLPGGVKHRGSVLECGSPLPLWNRTDRPTILASLPRPPGCDLKRGAKNRRERPGVGNLEEVLSPSPGLPVGGLPWERALPAVSTSKRLRLPPGVRPVASTALGWESVGGGKTDPHFQSHSARPPALTRRRFQDTNRLSYIGIMATVVAY